MNRFLPGRILALLILAGFSFSSGFLFHFALENPSRSGPGSQSAAALLYSEPEAHQPSPSALLQGKPIRIKIPKIDLDAALEQVGLTSDWAMGTPQEHTNAAWFDLGPRPGEIGTAVIAGHYGWKNGLAAAFDNLYKLGKGDKLYVENENGMTVSFVVTGFRIYGENEDAKDVFSSDDKKSHLNLITCGGVWSKINKSYSNRLVIFSDKEE